MRGENMVETIADNQGEGTSPRARGKLTWSVDQEDDERNIPACAGKTYEMEEYLSVYWEHPRVRGENTY